MTAIKTKHWSLMILTLSVMGCATTKTDRKPGLTSLQNHRPWQKISLEAIQLIEKNEFDEASKILNLALQSYPTQPLLHLLNGLVYEHQASSGFQDSTDLANVAYQSTIHLDPSNWYAFYRMGQINLRKKQYVQAQDNLAQALKFRPHDPKVLYALAMASYYAQDLEAATHAIRDALKNKQAQKNPLFLRAAALILTASGQSQEAQIHLAALKKSATKKDQRDISYLEGRMASWAAAHIGPHFRRVDDSETSKINDQESSDDPASSTPSSPTTEPPVNPVIICDCSILNLQETISTDKGANILDNFSKGISITLQPQNWSYDLTKTLTDGVATSQSTLNFTKSISWNAIQYNLNIFNVLNQKVEVLGRPTLSTYLGSKASFNSGIKYISGLSGSGGGSLVTLPTGTILEITPVKLNGDVVTLKVSLESSILFPNSPAILAQGLTGQIIRILQTKISTTVNAKLGESVALGGIYERSSQNSQTGVPGLQDIPLVQYFFSNENISTRRRSVLFLVTPRKLETVNKAVHDYLTLKSNRKQAPNLDAWVSERKYLFQGRPPSMALIIRNSLPDNYAELYRRGDILPMPIGDADTFAGEVAPLKSFLYF